MTTPISRRVRDYSYSDWKRAEKEYNLRKETQQFEDEPWYSDIIIMVSVLSIAVCLGMCYVMIVSKVHGY